MPRPLFDVPGWSVPTELASSPSAEKSKKRKRPHGPNASSEKLESAQVNLEKLMGTLDPPDSVKQPLRKKHKGKRQTGSFEGAANNQAAAAMRSRDSVEKGAREPSIRSTGTRQMSKEKRKLKSQHPTRVANSGDPNLTTLQNQMKKKLDGARFR